MLTLSGAALNSFTRALRVNFDRLLVCVREALVVWTNRPGLFDFLDHGLPRRGLSSSALCRERKWRSGPCVDGSGLARRICTLQAWSEQPCVRACLCGTPDCWP